jgi:Chaperone of endosialidase
MFKRPRLFTAVSLVSGPQESLLAVLLTLLLSASALAGDGGDAFTYQGQLQQSGAAATGPLDLVFRLYNAAEGGTQIGPALSAPDFTDFDDAGRFTVELAFGPTVFPGAARWLEITVEGVTLSPRQRINPVPYATRSLEVAQVGNTALSGSYGNALTMTNGANQFGGTFNGTASGTFSGTHSGSGASLTSLNASNIANGTLAGAILSGTYGNALTMTNGANQFGGLFNGTHSGNGANLTALHAANVTTGTLNPARLPANGNWPLFGPLTVDTATLVVDPTTDRIGVGTSTPQQALSVVGGANVDQNNGNTGTLVNTLRFGSSSGEAIGSNRGAGENSLGLDFWAGASKRMSITSGGSVGIGTASPTARLQVSSAGGGATLDVGGLKVRQSGLGNWTVLGGHPSNVGFDTVEGATIGGGGMIDEPNKVLNQFGTIGGGYGNSVEGEQAIVGGGRFNNVFGRTSHRSVIAGGHNNTIWGAHGVIGGGGGNGATQSYAAILGGQDNEASAEYAAVGGGLSNTGSGLFTSIGGGELNAATSDWATISGGSQNSASNEGATIGGGVQNIASGPRATVCGGIFNIANGDYAVVSGGEENTAGTYGAVGGGLANIASGYGATVPGGIGNAATGSDAFAAGNEAKANHDGSFVWADNSGGSFQTTATRQFLIRASGHVGINTNTPGSTLQVNGGIRARGGGPGGFGNNNNGYAFSGNGGDVDSGLFSSADGQVELHTNAQERLRILANGNVGIGTTTPGALFEVNGSAAKPGGGTWSVSSDIRLKKDVAPLPHALDDLLRLRGVTYAYIDPAAIHELEGTRMGFIAQEVEEVFPDWVDEGSRGFKRLTIRGFEALAVEAIRALRAEKDAQLAERDAVIAAQQQAMAERDAIIADHHATIAKLEHSIAASASTVAAQAADFDALAQRVKDLEGTIGSLMQERRESRR